MNTQIQVFIDTVRMARGHIKDVAQEVTALHRTAGICEDQEGADMDEMHANITLAYRHLEDAAMRLGKAIQAADGGKSVYDK